MALNISGLPNSSLINDRNATAWKLYQPRLQGIFDQVPPTTILYGYIDGYGHVVGSFVPIGGVRRV